MLRVPLLVGVCSFLTVIAFIAGEAVAQENGPTLLSDTFYEEQIASKGLRLIARGDGDVLADGGTETVLLTISQECGSCHAKYLSVYAGSELSQELQLDDPEVLLIPGLGLQITQPVRIAGEGFCCPSQFQTRWYIFNPDQGMFLASDSAPVEAPEGIPLRIIPLAPLDPSLSAPPETPVAPLSPLTVIPDRAESAWPPSAYCAALGDRAGVLYNFVDPDLAWQNVAAAHGVSFYNPILRQSQYEYRGRGLVYALWINRALQGDAVPYVDSLDLCSYMQHAFESGDSGEIGRALGQMGMLVPRLWCEQLKLRVRGNAGFDPRLYNDPDGRISYLLDLRDKFGPNGEGLDAMVYALALPSQGDALARSTAQQWTQMSTGILRTMDVAQCAAETRSVR